MNRIHRRRVLAGLSALPAILSGTASRAQAPEYPSKPIRLIVPEPPGGLPSTFARLIAEPLAKRLGQAIVVDNRPGAGGLIGTKAMLQESADGYTLLFTYISNQVITAVIQKTLPYHPLDDFALISLSVVNTGGFLVVRAGLPIHNPRELFAYARANPGKLTFASAGVGSITHLGIELIKKQTGTDILHVPFANPVAGMAALIGGDADLTIAGSVTAVLPFLQGGKVRMVARLGAQRAPGFPDVPTLNEDTVPGLILPFWMGFVGRAGMPEPIVARLNAEINTVLASDPAIKAQAAQSYLETVQGPPSLLRETIARDFAVFGKLVREKNITAQT